MLDIANGLVHQGYRGVVEINAREAVVDHATDILQTSSAELDGVVERFQALQISTDKTDQQLGKVLIVGFVTVAERLRAVEKLN
jgi:hypothetical protein